VNDDGFDYSQAWAASLLSNPATVHLVPDVDNIHQRTNGAGWQITDYRTKCGAQAVWQITRKPEGAFVDSASYGVHLFNEYAAAIDAHYCRRCWPELRQAS
jgi:hypothetical protein